MKNVYDEEIIPTLLKPPQDGTRGHSQKLYCSKSKRSHKKKHSFSKRVVKPWNNLSEDENNIIEDAKKILDHVEIEEPSKVGTLAKLISREMRQLKEMNSPVQ